MNEFERIKHLYEEYKTLPNEDIEKLFEIIRLLDLKNKWKLNKFKELEEESAFNKTLYENKKRDYLKLQAFYEKDYIRKDKIVKIIKELEKEQEENRRNLSLGIELLSNTIIDKFSDKIMINLGIREYLENILKGER